MTCMRARIVDAAVLNAWFCPPVDLANAGARLKCRTCGARGAKLTPVPA